MQVVLFLSAMAFGKIVVVFLGRIFILSCSVASAVFFCPCLITQVSSSRFDAFSPLIDLDSVLAGHECTRYHGLRPAFVISTGDL